MKRSQLTRKKQLARGTKPLKRTRLKPVSKSKADWLKLYREQGRPTQGMDSHHPFGRIGNRILAYLFISRELHNEIHANGRRAREEGWLQGPYDGRPLDPNAPRPWRKEEESTWPEEYRRK